MESCAGDAHTFVRPTASLGHLYDSSFGRDLGFWDPDKVLSPALYLVSTTRDPQLTLPTLQPAAAPRITTPPMPSSTGFEPPLPSLKASLHPPALETPTKYTSQHEPAAPTLVSTDPDSPAPVSHAPDDSNSFSVTPAANTTAPIWPDTTRYTPSPAPQATIAPPVTVGSSVYTADPASHYLMDSQTLLPGGPAMMVSSTPVQILPGAVILSVGPSTF
ncbi:hypothetical protein OEA41_003364 [Lepraria neglecta]|uniref:Uncharacterized protein n=1 Tax=Lepraria neglecta TaxID=209136 RepID=A0AAE0DJ89_9LECA|nr:hypothetical protein OEA41_003364 [Lepraria neglecta]